MNVQQVSLCGHTNGPWAPGLWFEPAGPVKQIGSDQITYRSKLNKAVSQKKLGYTTEEYVHLQGHGTVTFVVI